MQAGMEISFQHSLHFVTTCVTFTPRMKSCFLQIRVDASLKKKLKKYSAENKISVSQILTEHIVKITSSNLKSKPL